MAGPVGARKRSIAKTGESIDTDVEIIETRLRYLTIMFGGA
jgi:hypothetical protein